MITLSLRLFSFLCCLLVIVNFISKAYAEFIVVISSSNPFNYFCNEYNDRGNYTTDSIYATNLNTLLSIVISNQEIDYGFYNFSYGQNTNKINAIGLCRGDIKPDECRHCLDSSGSYLALLCQNRKEAIGWFQDEKCMLRYSDRPIFGTMEIGPAYYMSNENNATNLDQFNQDLRTLLNSLKSKAASGDSRLKYAAGNVRGPNSKNIYGLVQCTPDLSGSECDDCIALSIERIPIDCCKNKVGGRVVRPSCYMRFETSYLFYGPTAYAPPPSSSTTITTLPPSSSITNTTLQGKSNTPRIAIAITVPIVVVVVVLSFICACLRARKQRKNIEMLEDNDEDIKIVESSQFNLETIREATNDFSDHNKLGQGGFGAVYKGTLSNGQEIAVKRLTRNSSQGDLEFKNEVNLVAKLQHRNLVRLLGFCLEGRERVLVYEFVPNKSLDYFIFDPTKRQQLDWENRYKIIRGITRGIDYLHEDSRLRIIHRDLKASNILLDEEMNPKISDFGTVRLFVMDQTHLETKRIVGTYGYIAPEYVLYGQFSMKSDVFSFGVLILEIVSGNKNSGRGHGENEENLLNFTWRKWREGMATSIVDPALYNAPQNEIMRCIHIGLLCVQGNVARRPTMATILLMLTSSITLPVPSEPAFFLNGRTGNLLEIPSWEYNSGATRSSESTNRSAQESVNDASITEPFPR